MKLDAQPTTSADELEAIYDFRFRQHTAYRKQIWKILVAQYFSRFIAQDDAVLDVGCGYGEFINHVNEIHDFLRHRDWVAAYTAMADFFDRKLSGATASEQRREHPGPESQ